MRQGITLAGLRWAFTTIDYFYWQPLTWISHMLDCQFFGLRPGWHHLISLLFHMANVLLVWAVLARLTGAFWRSAAAAALFALHPMRIESVAWASERKDVLSGLFFLLAIWLYLGYVRKPSKRRYYAVCGVFAIGLLAKPMVMTLPLILLVLDWWPLKRRAFAEKLPMFAMAGVSSAITSIGTARLGSVNWGGTLSLSQRVSNALVSYVKLSGTYVLAARPGDSLPVPGFGAGVAGGAGAAVAGGDHGGVSVAGAPPALPDCRVAVVCHRHACRRWA